MFWTGVGVVVVGAVRVVVAVVVVVGVVAK